MSTAIEEFKAMTQEEQRDFIQLNRTRHDNYANQRKEYQSTLETHDFRKEGTNGTHDR